MTDNEIIKDFEKVIVYQGFTSSVSKTLKNTLDLINHQKAEIERLKGDLHDCVREVSRSHEIDKNKAIKEFAERLIKHYDEYDDYDDIYAHHIRDDIDFLLEEMAGEG